MKIRSIVEGTTRAAETDVPLGLTGVRVVDFGHYIAGPMAAVLLADAGADVVHVDPRGRPPQPASPTRCSIATSAA